MSWQLTGDVVEDQYELKKTEILSLLLAAEKKHLSRWKLIFNYEMHQMAE